MLILIGALAAGLAAALWLPEPPRLGRRGTPGLSERRGDPGTLASGRAGVAVAGGSGAGAAGVIRAAAALGAGGAAWLLVGGTGGPVVAVVVAAMVFRASRHREPAARRREREAARRELPHLVGLLVAPLRAGASVETALVRVCAAFPGPAASRFDEMRRRLALGAEPAMVWEDLRADPELGPLGRALSRSAQTGASVVGTLEELAEELADRDRAAIEEAARRVGVQAAVPLGLCLLPAFLLLGIVPVVASLLAGLTG